MARTGWSSANFLRYAGGLLTAAPLSIGGWANFASISANKIVAGLYNSASGDNVNEFMLLLNSGNTIGFGTGDGTTRSSATTSTTLTANTWRHLMGVTSAANSRAVYLDGGGKGTESTSRTPSGINRTSFGKQDNAGTALNMGSTDLLGEWGLWNIALSDADVLALAGGISPLLMHPEALVGYWPLVGINSPENNLMDNTSTLSIQGTLSAAAHPRILMPSSRGKPG